MSIVRVTKYIGFSWGGWFYLLPSMSGQRVLLLSPPVAEVPQMVAQYAATTVWADTEHCAGQAAIDPSVSKVEFDWGQLQALGDQEFDLILAFVPDEQLGMMTLHCKALRRLLAGDGLLFVQTENPLRRAEKSVGQIASLLGYWRWLWSCRGNKSDCLNGYAAGLRNGQVIELQINHDYQSLQNTFRWQEKLKQLVYRGVVAGGLSQAWVSLWPSLSGNSSDTRLLPTQTYQQVVERAKELAGLPQAKVLNYLILNQKAILLIGLAETGSKLSAISSSAGVVAVLCNTDYLYQRRSNELVLLSALRERYPEVGKLIPEPLGSERIADVAVCFQRRMPGMTIEVDFSGLPEITAQAQMFLKTLIDQTSSSREIDQVEIERFFEPLLVSARQRTPEFTGLIARLAARLSVELIGGRINQVLMHGDFKIENAMFSPAIFELTAVIDWDLGDEQGYPFLDLWYLLIYNRLITRQQPFFSAFQAILIDDECSDDEVALLADYADLAEVGTDRIWSLKVLFLFFHIGSRANLGSAPPLVHAQLEQTMTRLLAIS